MRLTFAIFAALVAFAPLPGQASPNPGGLPVGGNGNVIEVAVNCGPHAHYIRGHRDHNHQWVKGRCIRDHHH